MIWVHTIACSRDNNTQHRSSVALSQKRIWTEPYINLEIRMLPNREDLQELKTGDYGTICLSMRDNETATNLTPQASSKRHSAF